MDCAEFFAALGLAEYGRRKAALDESARRFREFRHLSPALPPQTPKPPPPPPPPTRWRFAVIPDEAITRRTKGSVRIALPGELEGYSAWVREYRIKAHQELGHVLTLRIGSGILAEKREKKSRGWKTVDRKVLDRKAVLALFREVKVSWDELEEENEPCDDPDWMSDGRFYTRIHTPEPLETEERAIASELLMDNEEEESWREES